MEYTQLGRTDIRVSRLCLGSMTWGSQNTEAEAHRQIDYALGEGINFIDTAEAYPTNPMTAETIGRTEEIIGSWLEKSGRRQDVVLATKIAGAGNEFVRGGSPISASSLRQAIDASLKRLRTDHVDLYQLHWPNRGHYHFRKLWTYDPSGQDRAETRRNIEEILETLGALVAEGKIRHIGLSNDTCWGVMQFVKLAEQKGLPRVVSVQNEYSLLYRTFDADFAELSHQEEVGLMAYSPLGAGLLSGKYQNGVAPPGSRGSITKGLGGRLGEYALAAVEEYLAVAAKHGLDPCQMALAFCLTRPFMTAAIIGQTSMEQLKTDIGAAAITLDEEVMEDIQKVRRRHPMPM